MNLGTGYPINMEVDVLECVMHDAGKAWCLKRVKKNKFNLVLSHPQIKDFIDGLLKHGVDIGSTDTFGRTPLHAAVDRCNARFVNVANALLENDAFTEVGDASGRLPVQKALEERSDAMAALIIRHMSKGR